MKQTSKRSLSFVLALMLVVSLFSGITVTASAETATNGVPVAFIDNGAVASVSYAEVGSTITLPEATNNGDPMYVFQGWVLDDVSNSTSVPETVYAAGAEYTVEDTVVFYALYNYFVPSETEPMATEPEVVEPENGSTLTIPEFNALGLQMDHNTYTTGKFYVTGTVSEIKDAAYGNMYLVDTDGNKLYIYGMYDENNNRYDSMNPKPEVGAVLTVYGAAGQFNDAAQMKDAVVTGWVDKPEPEVTEPPATEPAADSTLTIADAIALGQSKTHNTYTEGKYYVTGEISQVYNTSYGNMYITDDAGNQLTVYGTYNADGTVAYSALEVKPVAGDTITVYGIIGQYNGVSQMKNGWITDHVVPDVPVETEPVVIPEDGSTLTIPEFNKVGSSMDHSTYTEGKYYVTGTVSEIANTTHGNMYLVDADGNKLYIYGLYDENDNRFDAMNPQPEVGSVLTVYGPAGQYNGAPQMKNAVISAWENKPEVEETQPTTPSDPSAVTVTTNIGEYAAANSWADATQYATINMDSNITVTATGGGNTGKYYANGNNWRIYQSESPTVTIVAKGTIQSVKITYSVSNTGVLTLNGSNVTSGTAVDVNAASVSFGVGNTGTATNGQVRITAIEVVYTTASAPEVTEPEVTEPEVTEPEVTEPEVTEPEATNPSTSSTVTVTTNIGDYAAAKNWVDATMYPTINMDSNITVTATGTTNTGKYYVSGKEWRTYQTENPTVKIEAANATIQSVKITYAVKNSGVLTLNGSNITSGTEVTVNAASVTFGVGNTGTATNGQVKITAIEVVYQGGASTPDTPVETEPVETEPVETEPVETEPVETEPSNPSTPSTVTVTTNIADYASAKGWANGTQYKTINMDSNITVTATGSSNTGKYYSSGTNWRIYQTEKPTVTIDAKGTIQSVKITYSVDKTGVLTLNGSNVASGTAVDVNAASVSFGVGNTGTATNGQVRITAIEVVYSAAAAASVKSVRAEGENELPVDTTLDSKTMFKQVTDVAQLTAGSKVIITAASTDYPYALGTYQKSNNRGYGAITRYGNLVYISDDVQVITLEAVADSANLAFNVGNGYLYAASSTSNHLKTQTENDANGQWAITIDAAGVASVVAQGTNTRNVLRFNPNTNNGTPLFACYASGQYDIMFYVETEVSGKTYYTTDIKGLSCEHANETDGNVAASCVDCGYDYIGCADCGSVLMLIDFAPANGHSYGDWTEVTAPTYLAAGERAKTCAICGDTVTEEIPVLESPVAKWNLVLKDNIGVNFVLNLKDGQVVTATVAGEAVEVTPVQTAEGYVVSFDLAAAQMTDVIVISVDGMAVTEGYTIRGYAETILAGGYDDATVALVNAMLQYGAAAQVVFDHNANDLANVNAKDAVDNVISGTAAENNAVMSGTVDGIAYYGASLLHKSKMGVRFYFTLAEGADIASYTFAANGKPCQPVQSDDKYYIQINDIMPQDLDQAINVTVAGANGTASVSYSPMNYIVRQYNNNAAIKDMMQELYDYYVAAEAVA